MNNLNQLNNSNNSNNILFNLLHTSHSEDSTTNSNSASSIDEHQRATTLINQATTQQQQTLQQQIIQQRQQLQLQQRQQLQLQQRQRQQQIQLVNALRLNNHHSTNATVAQNQKIMEQYKAILTATNASQNYTKVDSAEIDTSSSFSENEDGDNSGDNRKRPMSKKRRRKTQDDSSPDRAKAKQSHASDSTDLTNTALRNNFLVDPNAVGQNSDESIDGPFIARLTSDDNNIIDEFIEANTGDWFSEKAIHVTIAKLLCFAKDEDKHSDDIIGNMLVNNDVEQGSGVITATEASDKSINDPICDDKIEMSDSIVLSHSGIEEIAKFVVSDRKQVVREAVRVAVKSAVNEMKERHLKILSLVKTSKNSIIRNQPTKELQSENKGLEFQNKNKEIEVLYQELEYEKNSRLKLIHQLEEKRKSDQRILQHEQERFIIELQRKHQSQIDKLRAEKEEGEKMHARALSSYMTASRNALKLLKESRKL